MRQYKSYLPWGLKGVSIDPNVTPETQLRVLLAQHRAGITRLAMRVSWPGMGQEDTLAGIELLGREVLPEVRRRVAAET